MKKLILLAFIFLSGNVLLGENLKTPLFQNVNIEGKILQLEIAPRYKNSVFIIGLGRNKEIIANTEYTLTKNNLVDLRQFDVPADIDLIATTLPEDAILKKSLIEPSIAQELSMLFSSSSITGRTINLTSLKTFLGYRYTLIVLLLVFVAFLSLRFGLKQSWLKAALVSSLVGFGLIDLTSMNDHLSCVQDIEKKHPKIMPIIDSATDFIEKAKPIIKDGKCIIKENMPNFFQPLIMKYQFAEIDFKFKKKAKKLPKGTFIITTEPPKANQKLILSEQRINLLQKQ
jgi:hypothetical protein